MRRPLSLALLVLLLLFCAAGCSHRTAEAPAAPQREEVRTEPEAAPADPAEEPALDETPLPPGAGLPDSEFTEREESPAEPPTPEQPELPQTDLPQTQKLIVLDPGHQARANTGQEPVGPGASEMKMKVSGGTCGVATGVPEYDLVLTVSLLLRDELESRGYAVLMTRETNDADLSNRERAELANNAGADVFLRIHANGSEDPSARGAMALCPTAGNPYPIGGLYSQCRLLADCVLEAYAAATGAKTERVWETDTMSGLNWCRVPVTLLEMGYMTNPDEDRLLSDPAHQVRMVRGIADGVDRYFSALGS